MRKTRGTPPPRGTLAAGTLLPPAGAEASEQKPVQTPANKKPAAQSAPQARAGNLPPSRNREPETGFPILRRSAPSLPQTRRLPPKGLVGRPVSELYAAIGKPLSSDYAPSCLDLEGEDGELVYDGFVVYTLKNASGETIDSVA